MLEKFYEYNFVFRNPFYMYPCLLPVRNWSKLGIKWFVDNYIASEEKKQNYDCDFIFSHWDMHFQSFYMSSEHW